MQFEAYLTSEAVRFLKKCDSSVRGRIIDKLAILREDPEVGKRHKAALTGLRSLRIVGLRILDYRAICVMNNAELVVPVIRTGHRMKSYD